MKYRDTVSSKKRAAFIVLLLSILYISSCDANDNSATPPTGTSPTILEHLRTDYEQLREETIAISADNRIYAQYAKPTSSYSHGILGDGIEAQQLVAVLDSVFYDITLSEEYVFEDITPRIYDVDGDSTLEFITIRTHMSKGAGIAIYKIIEDSLVEYAHVKEIRTAYRWLNIVAINDLDSDGTVELSWIETPHIGGTLKVAKITSGELTVIDEKEQYSNHAIGQQNLCLSVLTQVDEKKIFYVPTQSRDSISGFSFEEGKLVLHEKIALEVDFSIPLHLQYEFTGVIETGNYCMEKE